MLMKKQVGGRLPDSEIPGLCNDGLLLGRPWVSGDAVAICKELTGVSFLTFRIGDESPPDAPQPCGTLARCGVCSLSLVNGISPYSYLCPCGVPCACISLTCFPVRFRTYFLWATACPKSERECESCVAEMASGTPASSRQTGNENFDLAVHLLTAMADSIRHVRTEAVLERQSKRLTAHQKCLVRYLCQAVHTRYADANMHLAPFAAEYAVSVAYLSTLFSRAVGIPFRSYLQAWRLRKVREGLAQDRLSIKEIASRTGYNDPNRLRLAFKAATGLSPHEWRENWLAESWAAPEHSQSTRS